MEKCIDSEFSDKWSELGEVAFMENLTNITNKVTKNDVSQKIISALLPALHLIRTKVANGELVDAIVKNSEATAHSLHIKYMEGIGLLQTTIVNSKSAVDDHIDGLQNNNLLFHNHVNQSLTYIASNQQEIVKMLNQIFIYMKLNHMTPPAVTAPGEEPLPPPFALKAKGEPQLGKTNTTALPRLDELPCPNFPPGGTLVAPVALVAPVTPVVPQPGTNQNESTNQNEAHTASKMESPLPTGHPNPNNGPAKLMPAFNSVNVASDAHRTNSSLTPTPTPDSPLGSAVRGGVV